MSNKWLKKCKTTLSNALSEVQTVGSTLR